jgi:hypothetical protein
MRTYPSALTQRALSILVAFVLIGLNAVSNPAHAQKCVMYCDPPPQAPTGGGGSGGGSPGLGEWEGVTLKQAAAGQNTHGVQAMNRGDWQTALNFFERAAQLDPSNKAIQRNLQVARVQLALQEKAAAIGTVDSAIPAQPKKKTTGPGPKPQVAGPAPKQVLQLTIGDCERIRQKELSGCVGDKQLECVNKTNKNAQACMDKARPGS